MPPQSRGRRPEGQGTEGQAWQTPARLQLQQSQNMRALLPLSLQKAKRRVLLGSTLAASSRQQGVHQRQLWRRTWVVASWWRPQMNHLCCGPASRATLSGQ